MGTLAASKTGAKRTEGARKKQVGEPRAPATGLAAAESVPLFDMRTVEGWCEGLDGASIAAELAGVPDESGLCLDAIKSALAAADLDTAWRYAHRLKGMAANLGATRLAHVARSIEQCGDHERPGAGDVAALEEAVTLTLVEARTIARRAA